MNYPLTVSGFSVSQTECDHTTFLLYRVDWDLYSRFHISFFIILIFLTMNMNIIIHKYVYIAQYLYNWTVVDSQDVLGTDASTITRLTFLPLHAEALLLSSK